MKIAIVDDNKTMRDVLRAICVGEGHEVSAEFEDGIGLLDYVSNHHPDVVCLDFNLPGLDGLELLSMMDATANHVDVIMITGSDDPQLKGHAADLGANGFIHKPFEQEQITAELKAIMENRRIAAQAAQTPVAPSPEVPSPEVPSAATADPVAPATPSPSPAAPVQTPVSAIAANPLPVVPRTAVVVDDSASVRMLLKGILEGLGIKVVGSATSGREGVEVVRKTRPALVCLDVDMPIMTGVEALPHVRAASPLSKVVMVTGNAGRDIVQAAIAGGAKGYFLKPIRPAKVEEFMQKLLSL
jgi:DNA-binding NarL/FixJ family response regulator